MAPSRRKKNRTHAVAPIDPTIPRSFVIKAGQVCSTIQTLVRDVRRAMEPNTASRLKERKSNTVKDFVHVAGQLGVTHALIFSQSDSGTPTLRVGRFPRGPTLTLRIASYSISRDVLALQARPKSPGIEFRTSPLVVLNGFGNATEGEKHIKLMSTMFQNMFPPIRVQKMKLIDARRVVLFNLNPETGKVEFRQYAITVKNTGLSKSIKTIISTNVPNLKGFSDVGDYVLRGAFASESDVEDATESTVTLAQKYAGKNNGESEKRAIKLVELGPRMDLELIKIQTGICAGEVVHHAYIKKSETEVKALETRFLEKQRQREIREAARAKEVAGKNKKRKGANQEEEEGGDDEEEEGMEIDEEEEGEEEEETEMEEEDDDMEDEEE